LLGGIAFVQSTNLKGLQSCFSAQKLFHAARLENLLFDAEHAIKNNTTKA
jgi:hypothetical protein